MHGTHLRIVSSLVALLLACTASADKPKQKPGPARALSAPAKPARPNEPADSPEARGRATLTAQLAALTDDDAFIATFAKQAAVLTPIGSNEVHVNSAGVAAAILFLNPHAEVT